MQPGENLQQRLSESPGEYWAEFRNFRKRGKRGIASLEIIGPPNDVNMGYVLPVRQICATPERIASSQYQFSRRVIWKRRRRKSRLPSDSLAPGPPRIPFCAGQP